MARTYSCEHAVLSLEITAVTSSACVDLLLVFERDLSRPLASFTRRMEPSRGTTTSIV